MRHRTPAQITTDSPALDQLRIAYTRGDKLHAGMFPEGGTGGHTLCGHYGYRHPQFDEATAVGLTLSFNDGCQTCLGLLKQS